MTDTKEGLLHRLSILQRKEEEIAAMIQSVDEAFAELGMHVDTSVDVTKKQSAVQTGIRMKGQLSFRGKEKALEHFDYMDMDRDGFLNYEDFRGEKESNLWMRYVNKIVSVLRFQKNLVVEPI